MFCFSRANHASANLTKFSSSKLDKFTFICLFLGRLKLGKSWQRKCVNFFSLKLTFEARKVRILESIFLQNENWLRVQDFVDKNLRLVRISLLISAIQRVLRFFSWNLFYKSNRKLFCCVCIAWYKHSRRWENFRQLCKPSTSCRVCITVENSPKPLSSLYQAMKTRKTFSIA